MNDKILICFYSNCGEVLLTFIKFFLDHRFLSGSNHFGVEDKIVMAGNISDRWKVSEILRNKCWLTVTKNWWGWFDFGESSEHEESLYQNGTRIVPEYQIWYKKSGKKFFEISGQDSVGRTEYFDEDSAFQCNWEVKCQNMGWKSSVSETWMSQSEIEPTLSYCFGVRRNCP